MILSVRQLWVIVIIDLSYNTSFQNVTIFPHDCLWSPGCKKNTWESPSHFLWVDIHYVIQVSRFGIYADVS